MIIGEPAKISSNTIIRFLQLIIAKILGPPDKSGNYTFVVVQFIGPLTTVVAQFIEQPDESGNYTPQFIGPLTTVVAQFIEQPDESGNYTPSFPEQQELLSH